MLQIAPVADVLARLLNAGALSLGGQREPSSSFHGHLGRNFLKAMLGNKVNAIFAAVGHNFRLHLRWLRLILHLIIHRLNGAVVRSAVTENPAQALLLAS